MNVKADKTLTKNYNICNDNAHKKQGVEVTVWILNVTIDRKKIKSHDNNIGKHEE